MKRIKAFCCVLFALVLLLCAGCGTSEETESGAAVSKQETQIEPLEIEVMENRESELVFSISIDDYIKSFNNYYELDHYDSYLAPKSQWRSRTDETGIHSAHETVLYNFTEDEEKWSLPTVTVYAPSNADYIQAITLDFDDHSYTDAMFELYEELCFCTLKVFFPDLADEKLSELITTLDNLAHENVVPNEQGYSSESVPCAIYYKDGVGLYPYFAIGERVHLCIIPVTEESLEEFEQKGVEVYEIG